ncbi:cubilin-like isoform X2 [Hydractinia symbiolongicarpus]|uniref:cubilin-like isoform X2 n=1 Tax=Hydractinia symbiolongicarpus TaxID=13093 RepID=UPI002551C429|nr:cubilin-like isoform X2 [Hydractinia symbiolongicarpus]XP_057296872.1 cubilin-like isoform X2 [Hydractinia symbiolongicarpus]XP_057296873.1 cubilin-like isoform X2 [Hydractinia symbiolongicarpus]
MEIKFIISKLTKSIILFTLVLKITTATSKQCSQNLQGSQGTISTPNYPENYPAESSCIWTITVPKKHYIELTFVDFDVEPYEDCKTDVLEVKDGGDINSPMIGIMVNNTEWVRIKGGQYCNKRRPPKVITSTFNKLRLWFQSDSTIEMKGFKATFVALKEKECGGEINAVHGEITTPRFPLHYPRNRKCEWKIKVPKGKYVALRFLFFEVESTCQSGGTCKCRDSVVITDGHSNNAKTIGQYCFDAPPPLVTSGNEVSVKFHSDLYGRLQGFRAIFTQSSTERCGGDFFIKNGTIESPNFNPARHLTYPAFSECVWTITTDKNQYISLHIAYMDVLMSKRGDCADDYIEIRDGPTETSPLLGHYCNMFYPKVIISRGQAMYIRFHSNAEMAGKGFQIMFKTHKKTCSESLGMEDGRIDRLNVLTSSNFKIAHKPHILGADFGRLNGPFAWCSAERKSKFLGEYFEITFPQVTKVTRIATQGYTMYGNTYYVTKYKVLYTTGKKLKHYASYVDTERKNPYTLFGGNRFYNVTKENILTPSVAVKKIRIQPLDYQSGRRIHVCMRVEVYGCKVDTGDSGETLTEPEKTINYSTYKKTTSTWVISPEASSSRNTLYLFHVVALQADCATSRLRISYDGHTHTANETFCDSKKPGVYVMPMSRQIWMNFESFKLPEEIQGVKFTYTREDLGFGRLITSQHGVINGVHEILSRVNKTSTWLFKLPKGSRINLEFKRVHFPERNQGSYLLVKAGLTASSHIIQNLAGVQSPFAFVYSKNELRIEYHPGHTETSNMKRRGEGFNLKYSVWQEGVTQERRKRRIKRRRRSVKSDSYVHTQHFTLLLISLLLSRTHG